LIFVLNLFKSLSVKLTAFGSYPQAAQYFNSMFIDHLRRANTGQWNCKRKGKPRASFAGLSANSQSLRPAGGVARLPQEGLEEVPVHWVRMYGVDNHVLDAAEANGVVDDARHGVR
jgi:hypothetical protein